MQVPLTSAQQQVLAHGGSAVLVGAAGSGKTTLLVEKVAALLESGVPASEIVLATFAHRAVLALRQKLAGRLGMQASKVEVVTLLELAQRQLGGAGQQFSFATNNHTRLVLRGVLAGGVFAGTLSEAAEVIHTLKSRVVKPVENSPHIALYRAYQQAMDTQRLADRNDVVHAHVQGLRNGTVPPVPYRYVLLDNAQDATDIQLDWLHLHAAQDKTVWLAANDDVTAYSSEGAAGAAGIRQMQSWPEMTTLWLAETFRMPPAVEAPLARLAASLAGRLEKPFVAAGKHQGEIAVRRFATASDEQSFLLAKAQELAGGPAQRVGLITRTDDDANLLAHLLRKRGFNPASYARLIWEEPPAQKVLALVYVLLNAASDAQLQLVLQGFGCTPETTAKLVAEGLVAADWLPRGAPLPLLPEYDAPTRRALTLAHRNLQAAWQVIQAKTLNPREVFKGVLEAMLPCQPADTHATVLLAADMLLSLSGKLSEVLPRVVEETMPDMEASLVVAPVREVRNLEFQTVLLPYAQEGHWPRGVSPGLAPQPDHERHVMYLALSRTRGDAIITCHATPTPLVAELQGYV